MRVSGQFYIFLRKDFAHTKRHKKTQKAQKAQNKNKRCAQKA